MGSNSIVFTLLGENIFKMHIHIKQYFLKYNVWKVEKTKLFKRQFYMRMLERIFVRCALI